MAAVAAYNQLQSQWQEPYWLEHDSTNVAHVDAIRFTAALILRNIGEISWLLGHIFFIIFMSRASLVSAKKKGITPPLIVTSDIPSSPISLSLDELARVPKNTDRFLRYEHTIADLAMQRRPEAKVLASLLSCLHQSGR